MADYRKIRAQVWRQWLDGLPEEIYDKRDTAHIVRLLDVLCGDNGVGYLRKRLLLRRLQTSLYETRYNDLDVVYSAIFDLPRLSSEEYHYSTDSLLLWSEIQEMNIKDAMYRQRIWWYMLSFQYGGTIEGVALAAQAATGLPCQVLDGCYYYKTLGVEEESQGDISGEPVNFDNTIDFNGATILVMTDGELTAEQEYNLSNITGRIRPVDVHYTFMTRKQLMERLVFTDIDDDYYKPEIVEESSHWWNVVRTVTGRPDWGVGVSGNEWIEPSVAKEAPQPILVNRQESEYDYTAMVKSAEASSEHVGRYNRQQAAIFKSLDTEGARTIKGASNALSQASNRVITTGFYGDVEVIDDSYPSSYSTELLPFFTEQGRSHRFWSSDERKGKEWLEVELKRIVPINTISFGIFAKPVRVTLYFSSYEGDERVWRHARDEAGRKLYFTNPTWGGTDSAEMVSVDFRTTPVQADAVRLEFERLDVPYRERVGDDLFEEEEFPFSIECSDVSIRYAVRREQDFKPMTYEDMFGNRVDTSLRKLTADYAVDDDPNTYWLSQPNVGESAVEYLVLKVADKPTKMNFIELEAVYAGCQLNVYSTNESEPGNWFPYPKVYTLQSGRIELPMRKVTYVKLEFTTLCATPYDLSVKGDMVSTLRFPWDVRDYCDERYTHTYAISDARKLLGTPYDAIEDDGSTQSRLGIEELYSYKELLGEPMFSKASNARVLMLNDNTVYRRYQDNAIMSFYGEDMALEESVVPSPDTTSFTEPVPYYRFNDAGKHVYDVKQYSRTMALGYVVGIKDVMFGFTGRIFTALPDDTFYLYMQDGRFVDQLDGWEFVREERLKVSNDSLNKFETVDLQCAYPFRTFEFASNQKPPVEHFAHPSDMSQEWHALDSHIEPVEFGTSGTVLMMTECSPGSGIESEPELVRSMAIANAQVDVYPLTSGRWQFDCYDLFNESVFSMSYQLEAGKWNQLGVNFVPMPGGNWWDRDYPYRVRIPIVGPLAKGQNVFVPVVDFDALQREGMLDANFNKFRLVWFNGVDCRERYVDITDNMEIWFRLEQDLPAGVEANGAYDFNKQTFYGAYYLYFGGTEAVDQPLRDYHKVFDTADWRMDSDVSWQEILDRYEIWGNLVNQDWDWDELRITDDGTRFVSDGDKAVVEELMFLPDSGFFTMEFTPESDLVRVPDSTVGRAEYRFLLDYADDDKRIQMYTYEKQLVFVVLDPDGFESSFVSLEEDLLRADYKSHILVQWWQKGTAEVMEVDPDDPEHTEVNPDNKNRRRIEVYVDSATARECIPNVYDEKHYIDTDKVY